MNYRKDRYGNELSVLGYGCMRFTLKGTKPDVDKAEAEVRKAIEGGVNYFDAAYTYPHIEETLGEILDRLQMRDRVNIATKLPHYFIKSPTDPEKYFQEELRRLRTDHVDYYLMHMLLDTTAWERLQSFGIEDWIAEKKRSGAIREIGFSYHGNADMFKKLIDAYDWDFCQIQYNYMDEHSQAGVEGLHYAAEKGLPVIIMEPLRGGRLTDKLPKEATELFDKHPVKRTPAAWGFTWLYDQPEVTCVLSGMNSLDMVEENLKTADEAFPGCLTEEDRGLFKAVADVLNRKIKVPCTGCRYCMPCPHNVDIPGTFSAYNRRYSEGLISAIKDYAMCTLLRSDPTRLINCVGCGLCETRCPQHIKIREELKNAGRVLENPVVKIAAACLPRLKKF